jgi:integrase/recombinase XerD
MHGRAARAPTLDQPTGTMATFRHLDQTPQARAWIDFLRAIGRAPLTLEAYSAALERFLAFCAEHHLVPEQADLGDVVCYLQSMREAALAQATVQQGLCVVRMWFEHLVCSGERETNPVPKGTYRRGATSGVTHTVSAFASAARGRGLLSRQQRFPWIPSDSDWLRFLQAASERSVRDRLMLALAYGGALRRQELVGLLISDIDPAHRLVTVRPEVAKLRRGRVVSYHGPTSRLLAEYLSRRRELSAHGGPLFLSESNRNRGGALSKWTWNDIVAEIAARAELPRFTPHTLRHLRLTHLAIKGLALHELDLYAGHRSLESTMVYLHLSGQHIDSRITASILDIEKATDRLLG